MKDDTVFVVCVPVADLPNPPGPATRTYCGQCHTEVWIADSTPRAVGMRVLCQNCGIVEMSTDPDVIIISREQLAGIADVLTTLP